MTLTTQQSLRQSLLLTALRMVRDPEEALRLAADFEKFIVDGSVGTESDQSTEGLIAELGTGPQKEARSPDPDPPDEARTGEPATGHVRQPEMSSPSPRLKRPRWSAEQDSRLAALWSEGLPIKEIAVRLGRTPASVNGRLRQLGLPNRLRRTKSPGRQSGGQSGLAPASNGTGGGAGPSSDKQTKSGAIRGGWSKRPKRDSNGKGSKAADEEMTTAPARRAEGFLLAVAGGP